MSHKIEQEIEEVSEKLAKAAGEGSRGGKIIGHTRTGKPIYESAKDEEFEGPDLEDVLRIKKNAKDSKKMSKAEEELQVKDTLKGIMDKVRTLGPEGLKKASENLTDSQKGLLEKILSKAISMDKEAIKKPKNVKDLDSHEIPKPEGGVDEEEEKLVKPEAAEHKQQGDNTPEGFEGQVIKSDKPATQGAQKEYGGKDASEEYEMPKKEAIKEHKRLVNVLESDSKEDDKAEAKKQKKELKDMKKSEKFQEIAKSDEKLSAMCKRLIEKGMKKSAFMKRCGDLGMDAEKCGYMWDKSQKSLKKCEWNDLQADLLGSSYKRGRNFLYKGINEEIEAQDSKISETLKKGEYLNDSEKLAKSEKVGVTELIEKGLDRDSTHMESVQFNLNAQKNVKATANLVKSFSDDELAAALGIDAQKAKEILGEK